MKAGEALALGREVTLQQAQRNALSRRDGLGIERGVAQRCRAHGPWPTARASSPCAARAPCRPGLRERQGEQVEGDRRQRRGDALALLAASSSIARPRRRRVATGARQRPAAAAAQAAEAMLDMALAGTLMTIWRSRRESSANRACGCRERRCRLRRQREHAFTLGGDAAALQLVHQDEAVGEIVAHGRSLRRTCWALPLTEMQVEARPRARVSSLETAARDRIRARAARRPCRSRPSSRRRDAPAGTASVLRCAIGPAKAAAAGLKVRGHGWTSPCAGVAQASQRSRGLAQAVGEKPTASASVRRAESSGRHGAPRPIESPSGAAAGPHSPPSESSRAARR